MTSEIFNALGNLFKDALYFSNVNSRHVNSLHAGLEAEDPCLRRA